MISDVRKRLEPFTAYSIACAAVWAIILLMLAAAGEKEKLRRILPLFGGWRMGWTSATFARYVYPPSKTLPPGARDRGTRPCSQ